MATEIPLIAKVDVGDEEVVKKDDQPSFRNKNTLPYQGLLSNYRKVGKEGYITTKGNEISFEQSYEPKILYTEDNTIFFTVTNTIRKPDYTVDEITKKITSKDLHLDKSIIVNGTSLPLDYEYTIQSEIVSTPIKGKLIDEAIIDGTPYYIYKSSNLLYLVHNEEWEVLVATDAYFTKNIPVLALSDANRTSLWTIDQSNKLLELQYPTNNGWWDGTKAVLGNEKEDHYVCASYFYDGTNWHTYRYFGTVSYDGKLYGEPIPVSNVEGEITYLTPTRLTNGILRWELDPTATSSIKKAENTSIQSTDKQACSNTMTGSNVDYYILFSIDPINNTTDAIKNPVVVGGSILKGAVTGAFSRILIGDNNSPGVFTTVEDEYSNIFPCKYMFTNVVARRGVDYDYGSGWYKAKYQTLWFGKAKVEEDQYPVLLEEPAVYKYYYDSEHKGSVIIDALGMAVKDYTLSGNSFKLGIGDEVANETRFWYDQDVDRYYRHHIITQDEIDSNTWNDFIHTIDFDVSSLPFIRTENGWNLHYFGDNLIGVSKDGTTIGPFSTEYSGILYVNENELLLDNFRYKIERDGELKLSKISDYLFQINTVGLNNVLVESKSDESFEVIRGAIPYINEMIPDGIQDMKLLLGEDGSAYNDIWYEAAGVNVNLDDKTPTSSGLLPAVEVSLFVDSDNLDEFNNSVVKDGRPLFVPMTNGLGNDDELAVYYTHTQMATDILYRYSVTNGVKNKNGKFTDNSWWSSSSIIILPIGVGSKYSSVNYISSTVSLPDTYNARLYVNNNTAYVVYNAATQIYHSTAVFTIYASTYYYDGQAIYYTGSINQTTSNELVCYAIGMKFLANSGTEAYFYSDYDKAIYTFTGSNTLSKTTPISMFGEPISSVFSSYNQTLYLLNSEGDVLALSGESSALFPKTGATSLESIVGGCAFVGNGEWSVYSPKDGDILPIDVETDWIGNVEQLYQFTFGDIIFYDHEPKEEIKVELFLQSMNGKDTTTWSKPITIKKNEWKSDTYRVRINPDNTIGNAFKIGVRSNDEIHIMSMTIESKKTSSYNNTPKGWR